MQFCYRYNNKNYRLTFILGFSGDYSFYHRNFGKLLI